MRVNIVFLLYFPLHAGQQITLDCKSIKSPIIDLQPNAVTKFSFLLNNFEKHNYFWNYWKISNENWCYTGGNFKQGATACCPKINMQILWILPVNFQVGGWGFSYMILVKVNGSHTAKSLLTTLKIYPLDSKLI